jgi:hypothetical protein
MTEKQAEPGTKLLAFVLAQKRGTTMATELRKMTSQASMNMRKQAGRLIEAYDEDDLAREESMTRLEA